MHRKAKRHQDHPYSKVSLTFQNIVLEIIIQTCTYFTGWNFQDIFVTTTTKFHNECHESSVNNWDSFRHNFLKILIA